jgi:hypothetical protein
MNWEAGPAGGIAGRWHNGILPSARRARRDPDTLRDTIGKRRIRLNDDQRRRLAEKGKCLGRRLLASAAILCTPDTILHWHRLLIARITPLSESKLTFPIRQQRKGEPVT